MENYVPSILSITWLSSYSHTHASSGDSTQLLYLRARMYAPATGHFLTRDTWTGNANQPMSFNRWNYVGANPIRYSDPTGLCPTCFVFYFAGAGNRGDIDNDNNLSNNLDPGEKLMLDKLSPDATVKVIYPYENGVRSTDKIEETIKNATNKFPKLSKLPLIPAYNGLFKVIPSFLGLNSLGTSKANETWESLLGICPSQDVTIDDSQIKVTLIGYSGGSQIAYSTAQELSGRLFVDNLVQIAPTYGAYNQMANIGSLWELVGQDDDKVGWADELWHNYNSGYRLEPISGGPWGFEYEYVHENSLDIYQNGATRCAMLNSDNVPYGHSGTGSYFDFHTTTRGTVCGGMPMSNVTTSSRGQAVVDMLLNVIGIGR